MTTISSTVVTCCICGESSEQSVILSTNTSGPPDLDGRQPEMYRSTIGHWIMYCPHCGLSLEDISNCPDGLLSIIGSHDFTEHIRNLPSDSMLAWQFLYVSYIKEQYKQYDDATLRAMHAAWAYDDALQHSNSRYARSEAIRLIQIANQNNQFVHDEEGMDNLILVDLYRRNKRYGSARKILDSIDVNYLGPSHRNIYFLQYTLVDQHDFNCHQMPPSPPSTDHTQSKPKTNIVESKNEFNLIDSTSVQREPTNQSDKKNMGVAFNLFLSVVGFIMIVTFLSGIHHTKIDDMLIISGIIGLLSVLAYLFSENPK